MTESAHTASAGPATPIMRSNSSRQPLDLAIDADDAGRPVFRQFRVGRTDFVGDGAMREGAWAPLVEVQATGFNHDDHHGTKYTRTGPAQKLRHVETRAHQTESGQHKIEVEQQGGGLRVVSHLLCDAERPVVRSWTEVTRLSAESENGPAGDVPDGSIQPDAAIDLEYVSSFCFAPLTGGEPNGWQDAALIHIPHNSWKTECQWRTHRPAALGLTAMSEQGFTLKAIRTGAVGTWSSEQFLPMGAITDEARGVTLCWQIEHNGSWLAEIGDLKEQLYLRLSGPTHREGHWMKTLAPGETFITVPVAVAVVEGDLHEAIRVLNEHRRTIRRAHEDNERLPVIFNDYMNCLFADPTTEKELPLIDAAAEAGAEVYVIDAGWYAPGDWWSSVGQWQPSAERFPGGIVELMDRIRDRGMIPGLWLELEVMGIDCPLVDEVDPGWFFHRRGRPVIDHSRYQLDFRHPGVIAHADEVVRRLVEDYGVGYIKMDYNINPGIGTERNADSPGDGLLQHNRAYLAWVERVMDRYPELVIENCGSGGLRMDWAMLAKHPIQSTSDQTNLLHYASIAAAAPTALPMEQSAIWSYPLRDATRAEAAFNMTNAMLQRFHLSGHLAELQPEPLAIVKEGVAFYRSMRERLRRGTPWWPTGLPQPGDDHAALAVADADGVLLAVWHIRGAAPITIDLEALPGRVEDVALAFPRDSAVRIERDERQVTLHFPAAPDACVLTGAVR